MKSITTIYKITAQWMDKFWHAWRFIDNWVQYKKKCKQKPVRTQKNENQKTFAPKLTTNFESSTKMAMKKLRDK